MCGSYLEEGSLTGRSQTHLCKVSSPLSQRLHIQMTESANNLKMDFVLLLGGQRCRLLLEKKGKLVNFYRM